MGCFSLNSLGSSCWSRPSSKIKLMTVDGRCFTYKSPISVKAVLMDYPLHAIFHSEAVRKHGDRAIPLPSTLFLLPGHVYFIVPFPLRQRQVRPSETTDTDSNVSDNNETISSSNDNSCVSKRKVSFAPTPSYIRQAETEEKDKAQTVSESELHRPNVSASSMAPSVEVLPSPSNGVVRLKVIVSKRKLQSLLKENTDAISVVENLLSPLLGQDVEAGEEGARDSVCNNSSWRPALESIPEST